MNDLSVTISRLQGMPEVIGQSLSGFGGRLRCNSCASTLPLRSGDTGRYTRFGWPKCCGYTMTWWTQRQIDAGEMPTP